MSDADSDAGSLGDLVAASLGASGGALGPTIAPARPPALAASARPVVVVLGMHRSGTSLLSNVLHYLGVDMADATDAVSKSNPSGFWERPELVALHEEILEAIGRPVASPLNCLPFPAGWWRDKAVLPFRARLRDYVEQHRGAALGWWGFKDPRTCRLLPLWLEVFGQMGIEARFVWAIRSPMEAAASMAAKNPGSRPMSLAQAEMMWLAYNYDVLRYYRMIAPTVVCHREWFDDPLRVARRLVSELDLPGFYSESEFESCIRNIVQRSYWRQRDADLPAPALPLSQWIYSDVASRRLDAESDLVESHVANLEMMFQSIEPFVEPLGELPKLRDSLRDAEQRDADRVAELAARDERLRILDDELAAARRDAEAAARGRAEQEALASRRSAEIDAAVEARRRAEAEHEAALASREQRIRLLEDEVATASRNADVGSQALRERHRGELQRLESELDRLRALDATLRESERQRHELEIACDGYLARIEALKAGSAGRR